MLLLFLIILFQHKSIQYTSITKFLLYISSLLFLISSISLTLLSYLSSNIQVSSSSNSFIILLSRCIILCSFLGFIISSFQNLLSHIYLHLIPITILLSLSFPFSSLSLLSFSIILVLSSYSTILLISKISKFQTSSLSIQQNNFTFIALYLSLMWILQCSSFGRFMYFESGHKYVFSTLQVFSIFYLLLTIYYLLFLFLIFSFE